MGFSFPNTNSKTITYLFVDGSHFTQYFHEVTQKWFGREIEFNFDYIKSIFGAEKAFYYDCIDDIKNDQESNEQFENRIAVQEEKLNKIREVKGCHVYLGSLRRARKQKKRGQKEVDVMLAVQMMEHAFRENMNKVVLLSGDLDFRPLVESLVRLGLFIEVAADQRHISQELIHSADSHRRLTIDDYFSFSADEAQQEKPIRFPTVTFFKERAVSEGFLLHRKGVCNTGRVFIYTKNSNKQFWLTTSNGLLDRQVALVSNDLEQLILYFELKFSPIDWE